MTDKTLHLWGINHKNTPVWIREKITFSEKDIPAALTKVLEEGWANELVLLSTCNRTELYILTEQKEHLEKTITAFIQKLRPECPENISDFIYYLKKENAIRHLFRVASGLNSMILGESQILGQVKNAYFISKKTGGTGLYLNRLFNACIQTAKKVRTETPIGEGSLSIAFAAVELAQKIFKDLKAKKGLLIGAGKIGQLTAKNLRARSMGEIYLINRTFSKAMKVADQLNAKPLHWERLTETLGLVDFVISSTDHPKYIITKEMVWEAKLHTKNKPILMIDIAVPRDIDPVVKEVDDIFLHDIDDLNHIVNEGGTKRQKAIPDAMKIIENELKEFIKWSEYLKIRPTLVALKEKFHQQAHHELNRYRKKIDKNQAEYLEKAMESLVAKILRNPAKKLKEYSNGYLDGDTRIDVVREIFDLGESKSQDEPK